MFPLNVRSFEVVVTDYHDDSLKLLAHAHKEFEVFLRVNDSGASITGQK